MNHLLIFILSTALTLQTNALSPPKEPPSDLIEEYTLNHQIPFAKFYVDDTSSGEASHYIYSNEQINKMIENANKMFIKLQTIVSEHVHLPEISDPASPVFNPRLLLKQLRKEDWIYFALLNYTIPLQNSSVAIIGSSSPWIESLALSLGASHVTTVEYNRLTYDHPQITTISSEQMTDFYGTSHSQFDFIFSISSFDHDGLGRYGDPLAPNGDLQSMSKIKSLLKPDTGKLFLTVPIGPDVIVWNLHRRYGKLRLPLLLEGWEVVDRIGWEEERLEFPANWRQTYEPVFILKPAHADTTTGVMGELPQDSPSSSLSSSVSSVSEKGEEL
jgi:hypothetical protein